MVIARLGIPTTRANCARDRAGGGTRKKAKGALVARNRLRILREMAPVTKKVTGAEFIAD
jgi:hypothetical protein